MATIEVDPAKLEEIAVALEDQIKVLRGIAETRALSGAEKRTLATLESERDATREMQTDAVDSERRRAAFRGWTPEAIASANRTLNGGSPAEERAALVARVANGGTGQGAERADSPAIADFRAYIRTGEKRASMSYTAANGGNVVPNPVVENIIDKLKLQDPILSRSRLFQMQGGNVSLEIPVVDSLGATAWVGEKDARPEQDSPTFGKTTLTAYEVYTDWRATQTFIDSVPGIEDWISNEIVQTIMAAAGARFAAGTGVDQIKGLFVNSDNGYTIVQSGADGLADGAFMAAYAALPQVFQPNACWLMLPATFGTMLAYAYGSATIPLVQFVSGQPQIMGKPVFLSDSAPAVGDGAFPVFYGDLQAAYAIGMHSEVTILRDPYSAKPYVSFYATARIGGVPLNNQAGVLIESEAAAVS